MSNKDKVIKIAKPLLEKAGSDGVTSSQILDEIKKSDPGSNPDTMRFEWGQRCREGNVGNGDDNKIIKIDTARYKLAKFSDEPKEEIDEKESKYYQPFADYLEGEEIDICTEAKIIGNSTVPGIWNSPDVIGIKQFSNQIFENKIIAAEIKTSLSSENLREILVGFGQCCAYKLFSHKVYLVIPKSKSKDKRNDNKILKLCTRYNIGLILFDLDDPIENVGWEIINHPTFEEPDYDYFDELHKNASDNHKIKTFLKQWEII